MDIAGPNLERCTSGDIAWWTDPELEREGVRIAFTERTGGVSEEPYQSLNLAAHVGDDPARVDANRSSLLGALGLATHRERLTVAEQVHGSNIARVTLEKAGAGAWAAEPSDRPALEATDAMMTAEPGIPLLLCFADCVPVILAAPGPVVAVVHAGWRGALAGICGATATLLAREAGCGGDAVRAYVGPHIGPRHYAVSEEVLSQFVDAFGTVARAESGHLDLGAVVATDLARSGVSSCCMALLGACTAEQTKRFFSYRAEGGRTGRHGSLVCILP